MLLYGAVLCCASIARAFVLVFALLLLLCVGVVLLLPIQSLAGCCEHGFGHVAQRPQPPTRLRKGAWHGAEWCSMVPRLAGSGMSNPIRR